MEMVGASVEQEQIDDVVNSMMEKHGFQNKDSLTLADFQKLMHQYSGDLEEASLHLPGNH